MEPDPLARQVAVGLRSAILEVLGRILDDDAALVVAHGGQDELAVATGVSPAVAVPLGPALRCMEGIRWTFLGEVCSRLESLRLLSERTRISALTSRARPCSDSFARAASRFALETGRGNGV